jgi:hypothetical protein
MNIVRANSKDVRLKTSHYFDCVNTTRKKLVEKLGEPSNFDYGEKVTCEFCCIANIEGRNIPFTVYDWKEYILSDYSYIDWHIGAENETDSKIIKVMLETLLAA